MDPQLYISYKWIFKNLLKGLILNHYEKEQTRKELGIDQSDEGNLMTTTQEPIEICGMIMHDGTDVVLTNGDEEVCYAFD